MMIIYLDQGDHTYYQLCLATASNKVRFQFATLSFVSAAEREREKQFEAALVKKWVLSLLVLSAKLSGGQLGSVFLFWALPGFFLPLRTGFYSGSFSTKSEPFHMSPRRLPWWTGSDAKSWSRPAHTQQKTGEEAVKLWRLLWGVKNRFNYIKKKKKNCLWRNPGRLKQTNGENISN